jgi:hypothetical protein
MPGGRTHTAGRFMLVLDGVVAGFLRAVEGGAVTADVIVEDGNDFFTTKSLGDVRYEPVRLSVDFPLEKGVADWVRETWQGGEKRHDVSVVALDQALKPVSERQFVQSALAAVTIPPCDAATKESPPFVLELQPSHTVTRKPSAQPAKVAAKQKQWLGSNFRLEIGGLDCSRVARIDALPVRRLTSERGAKLDFPPLRITLAEAGAQTWTAWHDAFVVRRRARLQERSGKLTFLAPDLKGTLGELSFFGLGIYRLTPAPRPPGSDQAARLVAELYCERIELAP